MAQKVGYLDNNVIFEEGPFVMTCVHGMWRIEAEYVGYHCPALPDISIYELLRAELKLKDSGADVTLFKATVLPVRVAAQLDTAAKPAYKRRRTEEEMRCRFVDKTGHRCGRRSRGPRFHYLCLAHDLKVRND